MLNLDQFKSQKTRPEWQVGQLRIRGGETAKIRFITDYPDIKAAAFHVLPSFNATTGQNFYRNVYCTQQDGETCKYCESKTQVVWQWHAWVWVYNIMRSIASQLATDPVTIGDKVYYIEKVNGIRLLRRGPGRNFYIISSFKTYFNKYGTLCTRDYEWSRQGSRRDDTTFALIPEEVGEDPPEMAEAVSKLMPIEEYIKRAYSPEMVSPAENSGDRLLNKLEKSVENNSNPESIGEEL